MAYPDISFLEELLAFEEANTAREIADGISAEERSDVTWFRLLDIFYFSCGPDLVWETYPRGELRQALELISDSETIAIKAYLDDDNTNGFLYEQYANELRNKLRHVVII